MSLTNNYSFPVFVIISHNPEVVGSNPTPATRKSTVFLWNTVLFAFSLETYKIYAWSALKNACLLSLTIHNEHSTEPRQRFKIKRRGSECTDTNLVWEEAYDDPRSE